MMRHTRKMIYSLLLLLVLSIGLLSFFLTTTPGLYASIRLAGFFIPGSIRVDELKGRLLDEFSIGKLVYQHQNKHVEIDQIHMTWRFADLLHRQLPISQLQADTAKLFVGKEPITLHQINLNGKLEKELMQIDALNFNYLNQKINLQSQIKTAGQHDLNTKITVRPLNKKGKLSANLDLTGDMHRVYWTGEFHGLVEGSLQGSLQNLVELNQQLKWHDFNYKIKPKQIIKSPEGNVAIFGTLPNLTVKLNTKVSNNTQSQLQINADMKGSYPLQWDGEAKLRLVEYAGGKTNSLNMTFQIKDAKHGKLAISSQPGQYQLAEDGPLKAIAFKEGQFNGVLSPDGFTGKGSVNLDANALLKMKLDLPKWDLSKGLPDEQAIAGELALSANSIDFLHTLAPNIPTPKGQLSAYIRAKGKLGKPTLTSQIKLKQAQFLLPQLGLDVNPIDLSLKIRDQQWQANGSLKAGGKTVLIKGQGPLNETLSGDLNLEGSDFPILKTPEYQVNISPQLNLQLSPKGIKLSGIIKVPYARIQPQSFSNSQSLSEDVVYQRKEEVKDNPINAAADLKVEVGNDVELNVRGLHATLTGNVQIKKDPQTPLRANGELSVKKGQYKAYGQDLNIEQGQLLYTGGGLESPEINLRASKKINNLDDSFSDTNLVADFNNSKQSQSRLGANTTVGVEVTGHLTSPKIQLFANPSVLSQADILSMLVLGRPASQATQAGGQLLLTAISSMNLGGTNDTQMLSQLKQKLGFDFNVKTSTVFNQATKQFSDSTGVVVGKSLSKRLYLSYNVGLAKSDANVLALKYLLTRFISLQVSNSESGSGIDFLYSRTKEKKDE